MPPQAPSGEASLARAASPSSGKATRKPVKQSSQKAAAKPSKQGENFELRSLQDTFDQGRRYGAGKDELLTFYEQMLLIRRFEEKAGQLYGLGLIGGFCHLYIGQEAVAIGLQSALDSDKDSVITGYRDHGHMLAYGIDPKVIMAELTGLFLEPADEQHLLVKVQQLIRLGLITALLLESVLQAA